MTTLDQLAGIDDVDDTDEADILRSFVLTKGRTRTAARELAIETIVATSATGRDEAPRQSKERRELLSALESPMSVAEIAAHFSIPLRTAILFASEMTAEGLLEAGASATIDESILLSIRNALQLL